MRDRTTTAAAAHQSKDHYRLYPTSIPQIAQERLSGPRHSKKIRSEVSIRVALNTSHEKHSGTMKQCVCVMCSSVEAKSERDTTNNNQTIKVVSWWHSCQTQARWFPFTFECSVLTVSVIITLGNTAQTSQTPCAANHVPTTHQTWAQTPRKSTGIFDILIHHMNVVYNAHFLFHMLFSILMLNVVSYRELIFWVNRRVPVWAIQVDFLIKRKSKSLHLEANRFYGLLF